MQDNPITRRRFMGNSGALAGSSLLRISVPAALALAETACTARDEAHAYQTLTSAEARELDAISARILPTTDTPGAREAGVVYFFDTVLGDQFAGQLGGFRALMGQFLGGIEGRFAGAKMFSDLNETDQDAYLTDHDKTPFFGMLHAFTMMGFFAMSSYGGNKDNIGWKLIGFDGRGAAQPPFGYYDAQYMQGERDDD
ncbi:MAG: gluconate 2-dehydrogenase subunit 3 family protein [Gammaproteobacteria bacterium]|nr:gluconate 2-dehydrogenase subunit 3 family protein [Gammaproteobacteria bacterium]